MNITFTPLAEIHFSLLLKWLEVPHVKQWWDQNQVYTLNKIVEKYTSYVAGYKRINGINKPIQAYIFSVEDQPIGYIQTYNAYDFPRDNQLIDLPKSLAALDIFIGEEVYLRKNIGSTVIKKFIETYIWPVYKYVFVDPDYHNIAAVRAYEKAGFIVFKKINKKFWLLTHKPKVRLSIKDSIALEVIFIKWFLKADKIWVFGSRVDLQKKGGDIDLYIETTAETVDEAVTRELKFISSLKREIGDQKIDIVLNMLKFSQSLPIYKVAKTEGVRIL